MTTKRYTTGTPQSVERARKFINSINCVGKLAAIFDERAELVRRAEDVMEWLEAQPDLPGAMPHRVAKLRAALAKVAP
jgi:hypothetical protein